MNLDDPAAIDAMLAEAETITRQSSPLPEPNYAARGILFGLGFAAILWGVPAAAVWVTGPACLAWWIPA